MSLPTPWVDKIFDKLTVTYGQAFLRRWNDIDINAVKSDWAHELSGFAQKPRAIAWALENLPEDKPPTVLDFRRLCRSCPPELTPQIEGPKADPERVAAELRKLAPLRQIGGDKDHKAWARVIISRHKAGEPVASATLWHAQQALRFQSWNTP